MQPNNIVLQALSGTERLMNHVSKAGCWLRREWPTYTNEIRVSHHCAKPKARSHDSNSLLSHPNLCSSTAPPHPLRSTPIARAMFVQRSAFAAARRMAPRAVARRTFTTTFVRRRLYQELSYDRPLTPLQATSTRRLPPTRRLATRPTLPASLRATRSSTVRVAPAPRFSVLPSFVPVAAMR